MRVNNFLRKYGELVFYSSGKLLIRLFYLCIQVLLNTTNNSVCILYKSDNFVVVEKPYDMVINSNNPERKYTLQSELRKMFPSLANPKLCHDFYFVHRLDYATSGVICIALNKQSAKAASTAFQTQGARKYYLALVHGHIHKPYMIINKAIGTDVREKDGNRKMCTIDSRFCEKPRAACTVLLVLERGFRNNKPATKVLLCPKTGRRHQLRVHCKHIGHTIIGDYTYSARTDIEPHRTFLHSYRLILYNNVEDIDVTTKDPFDAADPENQWNPITTVRAIDENIFFDIFDIKE